MVEVDVGETLRAGWEVVYGGGVGLVTSAFALET